MNRSISADLIKCFSIFGVAFIHGSFILGCKSEIHTHLENLFRFCVPCFILIWAFYFEKSYAKKDKVERINYIKTRLKHLFIVYIIWSLLYFIYLAKWESLTPVKIITTHFAGRGWSGQYFFLILFQLLLLFPLLRWVYNNKLLRYAFIVIIGALYIVLGYYFKTLPSGISKLSNLPFLYWIPYVFTGIALSREQIKKLPAIAALAVFLMPVEAYILTLKGVDYIDYITPLTLICSILTCSYFLQSSIKIKNSFISKTVNYIGQNTMTIFVTNPIIILLLPLVIPTGIFGCSTLAKIVLPFLSTIIIGAIGLAMAEIIKKVKLNGILN